MHKRCVQAKDEYLFISHQTNTMQRRTFIKNSTLTVISISTFGVLNWNGKSFEGDTPTTTDILGPFYRPGAPLRTNLRLSGSNGTPIVLKGKIFKEGWKHAHQQCMGRNLALR